MSRTSANFFNKLGLLIPGFKGYKSKEDLRESDYQIRLYAKRVIERLIDKIEREKRYLDSDMFMEIDFHQKDLKITAMKIVNQKYGYKALFHNDSSEVHIELLEKVISNDQSLIELLEDVSDAFAVEPDSIKNLNNQLQKIIDNRENILS